MKGEKMKKNIFTIFLIVLMSLAAVGCSNGASQERGSTKEASRNENENGTREKKEGSTETRRQDKGSKDAIDSDDSSGIPIEKMELSLQSISDEYRVFGKVLPYKEVVIGANVSGVIDNLEVSVGDEVIEGDVLYTVDDGSIKVNTDQQLSSASNNFASAELKYIDETKAYDDTLKLYENGYVSELDMNKASSALQNAKLAYENALASYNSIQASSNISINNAVLTAPICGTISNIGADEGEKSSGADITIINTEYFLIDTIVSGKVVGDMALNDEVRIVYEETELIGVIKEISPVGINGTDSYGVKIEVENASDVLKIGFSVDVYYSVNKTDNQIIVPKKSVLTDVYGDYVYVLNDNIADKVYIEQGFTNNGFVQITSGLKEGDNIVIGGQTLIADGDLVIVTEN